MPRPLPADRLPALADDAGLAGADVAASRARHGGNEVVETASSPLRQLARDTARDPMIWFLVGTATLYAVLGQRTEALTLLGSLVPLIGMDAFLHRRTQSSTQGLRRLLAERARVIRDGAEQMIPTGEVVVGDLVVVDGNEPFPADGILVAEGNVQVDESVLTGESYPVRKRSLALAGVAAPAAGDEHWGLAGTRVLTGRAHLRVLYTGEETLYGAIVRMASSGPHAPTRLQRAVSSLVTRLLIAAGVLCVTLAAVRLIQGFGILDAAVSAVTLAVAAVPEEFPVVLTVFLGVGVYRLARRRALVRRAVAVENIGRVTCIVSDKTGTITEGRLVVARIETGAEPADDAERHALAIAVAASRAASADPLDLALLAAAVERGVAAPPGTLIATFPFTEDRRRETALIRTNAGAMAFTKGAPETILALTAASPEERERWQQRIDALGGEAFKVIACASRRLDDDADPNAEPTHGYVLAALIAITDPVRDGVSESISWCRTAGIRVLMVTGDHRKTAGAVARRIGLADEPVVVSGDELRAADGEALVALLAGAHVVARAVPAQKLAIVRALQARGELVAVTGDGVNDVPALQAADVGIAMGRHGTRSAREVSPIVLLDDDFRSVVAAIGEGRALFRNLQQSVRYLLMIHIPLVLSATLIPIGGATLLYLPIHIAWLELLIHPTALLAFQERRATATAPPAGREVRLLSGAQWATTLTVGGLLTLAITLLHWRALGAGGDAEHARATALVILPLGSAAITAVLGGLRVVAARVTALATVASTIALVQIAPVAERLHLRPLHADDWAVAVLAVLVAMTPLALGARRAAPAPAQGLQSTRA